MHDYLFGIEAVRFAFVLGIAVSMIIYEKKHLTTGSIVVPGYIGVFVLQPLVILATFVNALISYWLVNKVLPKYVLVYGRTKFAVLAIISIAIQALMLKLSPSTSYLWESDVPLLVGAGYVVPALVAHDMARQGMKKTAKAVLAAGLIVAAPVLLAIQFVPGTEAQSTLVGFWALALDPRWVPLAVLLSAATAWGLLQNYGLRAGGFVGAAYVGMLTANMWQVVFVVVVGVIAWLLVTRVLMKVAILFGRRKFSTMLLTSSMLAWVAMWIGHTFLGVSNAAYVSLASIALTPLFVPGLLANDMERSGPLRVAVGTTLGALFVIPATWYGETMTGIGSRRTSVWGLVALAAGLVIFWDQIVFVGRWLQAKIMGDQATAPLPLSEPNPGPVSSPPPMEVPAIEPMPTIQPTPEPVSVPVGIGRNGNRGSDDAAIDLPAIATRVRGLRAGRHIPRWFENVHTVAEKAFVQVVAEAHSRGEGNEALNALAEVFQIHEVSQGSIQKLGHEVDSEVRAFLDRPLEGAPYRYLWLDAVKMKVREGDRSVNGLALLAVGVNLDGYREVLGADVVNAGDKDQWPVFLGSLTNRGLSGVELVISDAHPDVLRAIRVALPGAAWQQGRSEYLEDLLTRVPAHVHPSVAAMVRTITVQPDAERVWQQWEKVVEYLVEAGLTEAAVNLETSTAELLAFTAWPRSHWQKISSSSGTQRIRDEVDRRVNSIGILPTWKAASRLVGALLSEEHDSWAMSRCYVAPKAEDAIPTERQPVVGD